MLAAGGVADTDTVLRRLVQSLAAVGVEHEAAVALVASEMDLPGLETSFPAEWARAADLRARVQETSNGRDALTTISQLAPELGADQLGALYQILREPLVRDANATAYSGREKLAGRRLLLVTQFFTDSYLADWLVSRTLEALDHHRLVVSDPCVGGGALLVVAYRQLLGRVPDGASTDEASDHLLTSVLRGYDLDPVMAGISRLALWAEASRSTRRTPPVPRHITSGGHSVLGSLDQRGLRPLLPEDGERLVFLTNPPFLGRRLMDDVLRAQLRRRFPDAGNDLCAAFVGHLAGPLGVGDRLGVVHQTSLLHLMTLETLRRRVLSNCVVRDAADLGPLAFERLTGDKARTTLSVLEGVEAGGPQDTVWPDPRLDVSRLARGDKVAALRRDLVVPRRRTSGPTRQLRGLATRHNEYAAFARPMQGSSTGDNVSFVRFAWEVPAADGDWVEASKGGGYAKWWGLRRYLVRWGRDGDLLRSHPNAALRNPTESGRAHLVWSDTGTAGLNVRVRPAAAVFMASGPGILVSEGDPLAHAAVLNSRLISAYLRRTNPKLSLTPGALARVPFPSASLHDAGLVDLATRAVAIQQHGEAERVDVLDWRGGPPLLAEEDLVAFADRRWRADVEREVERLRLERKIEERVEELFEVDERVLSEVRELVGLSAGRLAGVVPTSTDDLRAAYARLLGPTLRYRGGVRTMLGCDGPVEALSQQHHVSADRVAERLLAGGPDPTMLTPYVDDLVHQAVLGVMGFTTDRAWAPRSIRLTELRSRLIDAFGTTRSPVDGRDWDGWLRNRLPGLHAAAFRRRPILHLRGRSLELRSRPR